MDLHVWLAWLGIVACLALSFMFTCGDAALKALSRARILRMEKAGHPAAGRVTSLLDRRAQMAGAIVLANAAVRVLLFALVVCLMLRSFGGAGIAYATVATFVLIIVFAEALPTATAKAAPERVALLLSRPLSAVVWLLRPFVSFVSAAARLLLKGFGLKIELDSVFTASSRDARGPGRRFYRDGDEDRLEREMAGNGVDLRALEVADVMIHRTEMITVCADEPTEDVVKAILELPVTRIPLWSRRPDNFVGVLHVRDLLVAIQDARGQIAKIDIVSLSRPPWFVPTVRPLIEQLKAFRRRKTPLALVVDEYGEVMGLVTLEDILEEIVSDLPDERDPLLPGLWPQPDGSIRVDGGVPIRDLNRAMGWSLPDEVATTVAGLVIHEARSIPEVGQTFTFHGLRFGILAKDRNRITAVRITPITT